MQTKKDSLKDSIINTLIGMGISYLTLIGVNTLYGLKLSLFDSFEITLIFTVVSVGRNYIVRRYFNKKSKKVTLNKSF
jgi:hypothetical protein